MSHELAAVVLGLSGVAVVIAGLLFFLRPRWLMAWLRGTAILGVIGLGLYSLVVAINIADYQALAGMQRVASISISNQGGQTWSVTLRQTGDEAPEIHTLSGDQWQLDARIIRFTGPLRWLGVAPGYRLERLGGRYTSLEQERTAPRSVIGLGDAVWFDLDLWELDRRFNMPFVEGVYGNSVFMPMRDGATYEIRLSASGLVAVPVNQQAREAVELWH